MFGLAEREGFEPPVPCGTMVFKTTAFDHSAISPKGCKNRNISRKQKELRAVYFYTINRIVFC